MSLQKFFQRCQAGESTATSLILTAGFTLAFSLATACKREAPSARWWKGNLHTHSLWSDGDDYPEMIVDWYKTNGYQFLALSDHNTLLAGEVWLHAATNAGGAEALAKYQQRFGTNWVETRDRNGQPAVRLKTLEEFRKLFEVPEKFLLIPSEEISDRHLDTSVHLNATNLREFIKPRGGSNVYEVMQNNVDAVLEQRRRTGQAMFPHLNHPNFTWAVTAEELMRVKGENFFEVYNGHPLVGNGGDPLHPSTDRLWDIMLTQRLTELKLDPIFGLAVDDAHHYHRWSATNSNAGRGWVMVRAPSLTPENIIRALEAGDFYASSGVRLKDVQREKVKYFLSIDAEPGVSYLTRFIGTRKGFNNASEPVRATNGDELRVTHRYSSQVGTILAEVSGNNPSYQLNGDEIYVRAKVISSKLKTNGTTSNELEMAWTQPLVTGVK